MDKEVVTDQWPEYGVVTADLVAKELCVHPRTVRHYERVGLFPHRRPIGLRRTGWPVEVAKEAIRRFPERLQAYLKAQEEACLPRPPGRPRKALEVPPQNED